MAKDYIFILLSGSKKLFKKNIIAGKIGMERIRTECELIVLQKFFAFLVFFRNSEKLNK